MFRALFCSCFVFLFLLERGACGTPISIQPTEIIEESPEDAFTTRSGIFPTSQRPTETLQMSDTGSLDSLNTIPGLQIRESGSPLVSIRGSGQSARALGLLDGMTLNFGDGLGAQRLLVPTEILGEVGLTKGASSVFFGSDAMAGALRFRSRVLSDSSVRLGAGSFGDRNVFFGVPLERVQKDNYSQVTYYHDDIDGNYPFAVSRTGQSSSRSRNNMAVDRVTAFANKRLGKFSLQPRFIWARQIGSVPSMVVTGGGDAPSTMNQQALLTGATLEGEKGRALDWSYRLSWMTSNLESLSEVDQSSYQNQSRRLNQGLTFKNEISRGIIGEYFVETNMDDFREKSAWNPSNNLIADTATDVGTVLRFPFEEAWLIQPGYRYLTRFGTGVSSLALVHDLVEYQVWGSFAEGFRNPGLSDRYSQYSTFQGNPNLKPERSQQDRKSVV